MISQYSDIPSPNFVLEDKMPNVKIKSLHLQNFKVFEDYKIDFIDKNGNCELFSCFIGPNGCGKSTILEIIQLIFGQFNEYDPERLRLLLGRGVRDINDLDAGIYSDDDFCITAEMTGTEGDYQIVINKNGFIKDHPDKIKELVRRLCFNAQFDRTLDTFQLQRSKWMQFKSIFEAITGFEIEEKTSCFDDSSDPRAASLLREYVFGFTVKKPYETINHKECSAGEKKIIKCFSTPLNQEFLPSVILIDNVEMHVELSRHLLLIESLRKCFRDSQIFVTTHSYQISRNFGDRSNLHDLRMIRANTLLHYEPWRLYLADEIIDQIAKFKMIHNINIQNDFVKQGEKLAYNCMNGSINIDEARSFLVKATAEYVDNLIRNFKN